MTTPLISLAPRFLSAKSQRSIATAALLFAACHSAFAAPFSLSYTGTIAAPVVPGNTQLPGTIVGEPYTVSIYLDNGGSTANGQFWGPEHITCIHWVMNTAGNVRLSQALPLADSMGEQDIDGVVGTDANGALTSMFNELSVQSQAAYSGTGSNWRGEIRMYVDEENDVLYVNNQSFADPAVGINPEVSEWSIAPAPQLPCPQVSPTHVAQVPGLSGWGLMALSAALAGFALRRRHQPHGHRPTA